MSILPVIFDPVSDAVELDSMGSSSVWWPLGENFAYDFVNRRYMRSGSTTSLALSLEETRSSSAWVLQGDGVYDEIASGELAMGQGVGLQVSQAVEPKVLDSRRVTGINSDTAGSVAYTGMTAFGDVGGCVMETLGGIRQTNYSIPSDAGVWMLSRMFYPLQAGAKFTTDSFGVHGGASSWRDVATCVFDFDSQTTESGRAPAYIENLAYGGVRLTWRFEHDGVGSGSSVVLNELNNESANYAADQTDVWAGDFLAPPIITNGSLTTRAADNPVVIQGYGEEKIPYTDFSSLDGWVFVNSDIDVTPGSLKVTNTGASEGSATIAPSIPLIPGALYEISFTIAELFATGGGFDVGGQRISSGGTEGTKTIYVVAGAANFFRVITNSANTGGYVVLSALQVKQVFPYPGYNPEGILPMGPGPELLADGDSPETWVANNSTLTVNPDGTLAIASHGDYWNRARSFLAGGLAEAATFLATYTFEAGTSGEVFCMVRDSGDSNNFYASVKGPIGAVVEDLSNSSTITEITETVIDGIHTVSFLVTLDNSVVAGRAMLGLGPNSATIGEDIIGHSMSLKRASVALGTELVEGGGFDGTLDAAWEVTNEASQDVFISGGVLNLPRDPDTSCSYVDQELSGKIRAGGVFRFSLDVVESTVRARVSLTRGAPEITGAGHSNIVTTGAKEYHALTPSDTVWVRLFPMTNDSVAQVDNISLQEIEPGVVIEAVGVWGNVEDNRFLKLTDNDDNHIIVRRSASGKVHLRLIIGGVLTDLVSVTDWPDDLEATFRLELTNTDDGCFAAVFLDDVFVIGSDAFDYPNEINQLSLAPVAGTTIIKEVYGK
ncbi:MAG: hypothetical protein P1U50_01185 [Parvibaculaceae bacterium]|nr:hypothetical protein [Parvibaculaceae bacterium]